MFVSRSITAVVMAPGWVLPAIICTVGPPQPPVPHKKEFDRLVLQKMALELQIVSGPYTMVSGVILQKDDATPDPGRVVYRDMQCQQFVRVPWQF